MSREFKRGDLAITLKERMSLPISSVVVLSRPKQYDGKSWWLIGTPDTEKENWMIQTIHLMPLLGDFAPEQQKQIMQRSCIIEAGA